MEKFLQPGDRIFLDDGKIELKVSRTEPGWIHSKVVIGGQLAERKGVNVSRILPLPVITEHDVKALEQGIELGVDYVAVSFAREPKNILEVKKILKKRDGSTPMWDMRL
jgi:pyruvate kinase